MVKILLARVADLRFLEAQVCDRSIRTRMRSIARNAECPSFM